MHRLSSLLLIITMLLCLQLATCSQSANQQSLRRILPKNLLHEITWDNLVRFWHFVMNNFQEWAKNKLITLIFKNIVNNLSV